MSAVRRHKSTRPDLLCAAVGAAGISDALASLVLIAGMMGVTGVADRWLVGGGVLYLSVLLMFRALMQLVVMTDPHRQWFSLLVSCLSHAGLPLLLALDASRMGTPWSPAMMALSVMSLWAVPEFLLLRRGWTTFQESSGPLMLTSEEELAPFLEMAANQDGDPIMELSSRQPVMLVFLRQFGCPFCRQTLTDIRERRAEVEDAGFRIALVHMVTDERAAEILQDFDLQTLDRIEDRDCDLYRAFGLGRGGFIQLFGISEWFVVFAAALRNRNGYGPLEGDGFRMPGVFVIHRGKVVAAYRHERSSSRPDYVELTRCASTGECADTVFQTTATRILS
jgi:peroxiredoxin